MSAASVSASKVCQQHCLANSTDCKDQIQNLVFFSVLDADNKSYEMGSEFGEGERILKECGINNLTIVRPTFLFSNFLIDCKNIKEKVCVTELLLITKGCLCRPLGQNCINIVSDHDVAECICQCLLGGAAQGSKTLCIGGKECVTMTDVCKNLTNKVGDLSVLLLTVIQLGKEIKYCDCSLEEFEKYIGGVGLSREGVQSYLGLMKFARDGGYNRKFDDYTTLLRKDPLSFQEMLQKEIECFK